jgi:hypothetical protein
MICEICGCSESRPCEDQFTGGACHWARPNICSNCFAYEEDDEQEVEVPPTRLPTSPDGRFPTFHPRQVA